MYNNKIYYIQTSSSDAHWTCTLLAVEAVCSTFDAILAILQCLVVGDDKVKAVEAKDILLKTMFKIFDNIKNV